jgi:hypothetical protein
VRGRPAHRDGPLGSLGFENGAAVFPQILHSGGSHQKFVFYDEDGREAQTIGYHYGQDKTSLRQTTAWIRTNLHLFGSALGVLPQRRLMM